ncbi:MAG: efflux RND transporter periplasmic adaptor subunit, partial [Bacteroidia bacterium]
MNRLFTYAVAAGTICLLTVSCGRKNDETKPIRKDITLTVFATGELEAENTYHLTAQTDGQLTVVNFAEGDLVKKDDVLAIIENNENIYNTESAKELLAIAQINSRANAPLLTQAVNNAEAAKQKMLLDSVQFLRYEKLIAKQSVSQTEYENIRQQYINSKINYRNLAETLKLSKQEADKQLINSENQEKLSSLRSGQNQLRAL